MNDVSTAIIEKAVRERREALDRLEAERVAGFNAGVAAERVAGFNAGVAAERERITETVEMVRVLGGVPHHDYHPCLACERDAFLRVLAIVEDRHG